MNKKCITCNEIKNETEFKTKNQCILCRKKYQKEYSIKNRDKIYKYYKKDRAKKRAEKEAKKIKLTEEEIKIKKEKARERANFRARERYKYKIKDPFFKLKKNIKIRLIDIFRYKNFSKTSNTITLVGCSYKELMEHIEKQFQPGMTWQNHERYGWHVDHIIPLSSAKTKEELEKLCHYSNLQPLWWKDNILKSNKIIKE